MRVTLRSLIITAVIGGVVFACGSSEESSFDDGSGTKQDSGTVPPGSFTNGDSGDTPNTCVPKTCASENANCGPIGDGCGNIIECGTCGDGKTCGGGGTPSQCGAPACTKLTCAEIGATCGDQADGCGGILPSCGACPNGQLCVGNPSKCGPGTIDPDAGPDGGVVCNPKGCTEIGANCGQQADGCGSLINCGTCNAAAGETCGGGGTPNRCGKTCQPIKTCPAGQNCGAVADGCGGIVSCGGTCATGTCGGGGQPNVCGTSTTCTGLCTQQTTCTGGGTTSISGKVTSPNGVLPIYGALVFVPTTTPAAFSTGVSCDQCGASAGTPLVSTTTGPDGKFLLPNMPVSSGDAGKVNDIPVVIQLGRWRKQITVRTTRCATTTVPEVSTSNANQLAGGAARPATDKVTAALPRKKAEGDIPLTAISTGNVDGLECVFRKLGIEDAEFTNPSGNGRIRFYQDNGAVISDPVGSCSSTGASCSNYGDGCGRCSFGGGLCTNPGGRCAFLGLGTCQNGGTCNLTSGTPPARFLYNDPNELAKYDMTLFECVDHREDKSATAQANVRDYANKGGRVYATHFSYVWLYNSTAAPWNQTASWDVDRAAWNSAIATIDTSFPKGQAFAQWLNIVGGLNAPLPAGGPPWTPAPKITIEEARDNVNSPVVAPAQRWLYTTTADSPNAESVQHYTFNTDWTKPAAQQCGRVLFSAFHVSTDSTTSGDTFPSECNNKALTTQEKVLAFMLFDLASCVSAGPPPSTCKPKTCAEQGVQCGQSGDGCGNIITCPNCPAGQSCGGGGEPNKCGASSCTPGTCPANACGQIGNGCGGVLDCGTCQTGTCGGAGTPNRCGVGTCTPQACPTPAIGSQCGPVANGCGSLNSCACPAGASCINGKCATSTCSPRTCAQAGANCGQVADGCGSILNCGTCLAPASCGGGGIANVCGGGVN